MPPLSLVLPTYPVHIKAHTVSNVEEWFYSEVLIFSKMLREIPTGSWEERGGGIHTASCSEICNVEEYKDNIGLGNQEISYLKEEEWTLCPYSLSFFSFFADPRQEQHLGRSLPRSLSIVTPHFAMHGGNTCTVSRYWKTVGTALHWIVLTQTGVELSGMLHLSILRQFGSNIPKNSSDKQDPISW